MTSGSIGRPIFERNEFSFLTFYSSAVGLVRLEYRSPLGLYCHLMTTLKYLRRLEQEGEPYSCRRPSPKTRANCCNKSKYYDFSVRFRLRVNIIAMRGNYKVGRQTLAAYRDTAFSYPHR
jgi:hypothetical protein